VLPVTLADGLIEQIDGLRLIEYLISYITVTEVKESRNRPGVTQRVPGGLGSQIL
jgi:hypothetical protein